MNPGPNPAHRSPRAGYLAVAALLATYVLAGCGSGAGSGAAKTSSASPATSRTARTGAGSGTSDARQAPPAASGIVAALSPPSMEVQNPSSGQTTVTYSANTVFSETAPVQESAITTGECITAVPATASSASSPGAAPARTVTAAAIIVSQPVNGSCQRGFASRNHFGNGTPPPGHRPGGTHPSRAPGDFRAIVSGTVSGTVTSVSGTSINVRSINRQSGAAGADTVQVTAATKISETRPATAAALQVGRCVTAIGASSSTGAVSAKRISISPAVNGSCSAAFGGRGFGGRFGRGGTQGNGTSSGGSTVHA